MTIPNAPNAEPAIPASISGVSAPRPNPYQAAPAPSQRPLHHLTHTHTSLDRPPSSPTLVLVLEILWVFLGFPFLSQGLEGWWSYEFAWRCNWGRGPWQVQGLQVRFPLAEGGASVPGGEDCALPQGWQVRRARGSWCAGVPGGRAGVSCCRGTGIGGKRRERQQEEPNRAAAYPVGSAER